MNINTFTYSGAVTELKSIMDKHNVSRLMIVHGRKSYIACGGEDLMRKLTDTHDMTICEFSDFSINPKMEDVSKGADSVRMFNPDAIIAIGGGSAMDMAKLMRYVSKQTKIPLIAIPTTSGTGAETTQFAVCYIDGKKESIDRTDLLPDYALLIPELTINNDAYLTACTGFDALAQAIESYWNINTTSESEMYAEEAISYLSYGLPNLLKKLEQPLTKYEQREQIMQGAHCAGKAINITRTTAPHAISYVLTSKYGYPHGHAVALTFPYFFEKNVRCSKDEYAGKDYWAYHTKMQRLVQMMGWDWNDDLYEKMKQYISDIGLEYDVRRPFEPDIVEDGINIERAKNNPLKLTKDIIKEAVASITK